MRSDIVIQSITQYAIEGAPCTRILADIDKSKMTKTTAEEVAQKDKIDN